MNLSNTQFVFEGKTKRTLIAGMVLGAICLVLTFFGDDQYHTRFWTNYLHNSVYFTGISFMALAFMCAQIVAFGGWMTVIRRIWESMSLFILIGIALMLPLVFGVWGHFHHLYHWNTPGVGELGNAAYDRILAGKTSFLNPVWYTVGTVGFLALWYFWANGIRKVSVAQDSLTNVDDAIRNYKQLRRWSASFLPVIGFLVCVFIWQSVMSIDGHWYSTMFAWYSMISMMLGSIAMMVLLIIYMKSKGYLEYVSRDHLHDVGKFLFGISVFWAYLWFDQFMLIWYANNGEETIYFKERMNHYPVLFWGNLLLNFITPFFILMRNDTKRKFGTMFFVACIVLFGHWWDYFYMIKPGARINAHHHTELLEGKHHGAAPAAHDTHSAAPSEEEHTDEDESAHAANTVHESDTTHAQEKGGHGAETHGTESHVTESHGTEAHGEGTPHTSETPKVAEGATSGAKPAEAHPVAGDEHGDPHGEHVDPSKSFKLGYTIPGLEELGIMLGFLSLFLFVFFSNLERASLIPAKDPFLEESLHHETGAMIESEQHEGGHDDHH
jgi:hypothetical protein